MNSLPPLRTTRMVGQQSTGQGPVPATTAAPKSHEGLLSVPGLPPAARALFQEILALPLVESSVIRDFLARSADKLAGLTTRDRAAAALAHAGILTEFQRSRLVNGNTSGLIFGQYRILDRLGDGSVGIVFLGEHVLLRRKAAIKVLPVRESVSAELIGRFHSEMRTLAALDHPHVVTAYDAGFAPASGPDDENMHYLVLELVPGGDVEHFVYDHGPQPVARACEWARQAASGLQAAHDRCLVHRDIKPSNLMLTADRRVKVVDFGLVRQFSSSVTRARSLVGSLDFMAPEQCLDPTSVSPAADVYGLGATLFWTLTGELPIPRGPSLSELVKSLPSARPRRVRELRTDVPEALDALIARMMARDPADRPSAVEAMNELLPFTAAADDSGSAVVSMRETVRSLKGSLKARDEAVQKAQSAVLYTMARMAESHDGETEGHLRRMREYVRVLVGHLAVHPQWRVLADTGYVAELLRCVQLHDIGKISLPDSILTKTSELTAEEWTVVESHPAAGAAIIDSLAREHGETLPFLSMARAIVRHHHERWDGTGYPDQLAAEKIPPAARLVAMADAYDALRRDRPQRPGLSHAEACLTIAGTEGYFDPTVRAAFQATQQQFEEIHLTITN